MDILRELTSFVAMVARCPEDEASVNRLSSYSITGTLVLRECISRLVLRRISLFLQSAILIIPRPRLVSDTFPFL